MHQRRHVIWIVICAVLGCSRGHSTTQGHGQCCTDVAAARAAIERANARIVDALLRGDASAMTATYAEDAVVLIPGEPAWRGRGALEAKLKALLSASTYTDAVLRTNDVQLAGDLAVETGSAWLARTVRGAATPEALQLQYLTVWRHQPDGSLRIIRDAHLGDVPRR